MTTLSTILSADFPSTCPLDSHCLCHKKCKEINRGLFNTKNVGSCFK